MLRMSIWDSIPSGRGCSRFVFGAGEPGRPLFLRRGLSLEFGCVGSRLRPFVGGLPLGAGLRGRGGLLDRAGIGLLGRRLAFDSVVFDLSIARYLDLALLGRALRSKPCLLELELVVAGIQFRRGL